MSTTPHTPPTSFGQKPNWNQFVPVMIEQANTKNKIARITPQPQPVHEHPRPKPKVSCSQSNSQVSMINFRNPDKQPGLPLTVFSLYVFLMFFFTHDNEYGKSSLLYSMIYVLPRKKLQCIKQSRSPGPAVPLTGVKRPRWPACLATAKT